MADRPGPHARDRVPPAARFLVVALVTLMLLSAIFEWEIWPLTSFRLFSNARIDRQTAWLATIVGRDGPRASLSHHLWARIAGLLLLDVRVSSVPPSSARTSSAAHGWRPPLRSLTSGSSRCGSTNAPGWSQSAPMSAHFPATQSFSTPAMKLERFLFADFAMSDPDQHRLR